MADAQATEPQNTQQPTSYEDAVASRPHVYIRTDKSEPKNTEAPVSFDDVFKNFEANKVPEAPAPAKSTIDTVADNLRKGEIDKQNTRLGAIQRTSQVPNKDDYVGKAVHGSEIGFDDEKDPNHDVYFLQDEKGNYAPADTKKHVVFHDPDTGETNLYNRNPDKDRNVLTSIGVGLGSLVQEGFQAAPGVAKVADKVGRGILSLNGEGPASSLPHGSTGPTRGQEALTAAGKVADTTEVAVPVSQAAVTENKLSPAVAKGLQALPGGSAPFDKAAANTEAGLAGAAANATSGSSTAEHAGNTAREAIEATAKPKTGVLAQKVSDAYDKLDTHMAPDATRDLSETRKVAQDIQSRFEATRGESGTTKIDPTINEVLSAATDPKGVSYQGLKDLRTRVGEMLEGGTKISETGVSDKQLRNLYKGLTDDMRGMVQQHGGARGLQLWERANNFARLASERRETLGKVLGVNRSDEGILGAIERMAGSTNSADSKTLAAAKKSIPADEWNEIAQTVASRLGKVKTDQGVHFDPSKFVRDYDKVSDRGKALLFGDQQRLRKALDSISELSKFKEPIAHTGPVAHLLAAGLVVGHAHGEGGVLSRLGHVVAGVFSMKALGAMLAKPATAESVAKWMEGYKMATLKPTKGNVTLFQRLGETLANRAAEEDREHIGDVASKAAELAKRLGVLISPMSKPNGQ